LKIEDADESELLDGFDKRIEKIKSENELFSIKNSISKNAKTPSQYAKSTMEQKSQKATATLPASSALKPAPKQDEMDVVANKKQLELEHELSRKLEIRSDLKKEFFITEIEPKKTESANKLKENSDKNLKTNKANSNSKSVSSSSSFSSSTLTSQSNSTSIVSNKPVISDQVSSYVTQPIDFETAKVCLVLILKITHFYFKVNPVVFF